MVCVVGNWQEQEETEERVMMDWRKGLGAIRNKMEERLIYHPYSEGELGYFSGTYFGEKLILVLLRI